MAKHPKIFPLELQFNSYADSSGGIYIYICVCVCVCVCVYVYTYIYIYAHIYLYMMRKNMKTNIRINCVNLRDHLTSLGFKCCLCEVVMNKKGLAGIDVHSKPHQPVTAHWLL